MSPTVKYELKDLETLTCEVEQRTSRDIPTLKKNINREVERIKEALVFEIFHFEDERHLERYIQYHQQAIIRWMDKLEVSANGKDRAVRMDLYKGFEGLLTFIERHFTKYFDQDAKAPEGYILQVKKHIGTHTRVLEDRLTNRGAESRLLNTLFHLLKRIQQGKLENEITYRKVMYAKETLKELLRVVQSDQPGDTNEDLRQVMYYLNYNSIDVVTYHAHYVSELLDETETRAEKIEKLSWLLKKVNQAQVKPGVGYNLQAPSLKDQLNNYIREEIDYQERLQRLTVGSNELIWQDKMKGFKLKFEASVAQLAYLFKIGIEMKIILNSNLTQILNFAAASIVTKRAEVISYGSLRSKYYNVETGTKESVRAMLTTMIRYIDNT